MSRRNWPRAASLLALVFALTSMAAFAQQAPTSAPDPDVVSIRSDYDLGKYEDAFKRAKDRIDRGGLPEDQTLELQRIAGLSAFNLGKTDDAEHHFSAVLRLDPDYALDPFTVPPPAMQLFEKVRKDLGPTLDAIRYERRLKAEREKKEAEDRAKAKAAEEEKRRKLEAMANAAASRTVERHSFVMNFVPFGVGQFQEGRKGIGVTLAVSEAVLGLVSVVGYFGYRSLVQPKTVTLTDLDGNPQITYFGIAASDLPTANVYKWMQLGAGAAFWTVYAFGVVDAIYNYTPETVVTTTPDATQSPRPTTSFHLLAVPNGAGAGLTVRF